jgi:hypothetical protein
MGKKWHAYRIFVRILEGKRTLDRLRYRRVDNIINLKEVEGGAMDWIELAQNSDQWRALVDTIMNLWVL